MVEVTCEACPSLAIPHLGVQFVDGRASVTEEQSEALKPYVVHGVEVEHVEAPKAAPRRHSRKDD